MTMNPMNRAIAAAAALLAATGVLGAGHDSPRHPSFEWFETKPAEWTADNADHGFRIVWSGGGLRVSGRAPSGIPWEWSVALRRAGSPSAVREVDDAFPSVDGARLDVARVALDESLANGARGLEYGLRFVGPGGPGPLLADYAVGGRLVAKVSDDGREVAFLGPSGSAVLVLRDLQAVDADGRDVDLAWATSAPPGSPKDGLRLLIQSSEHAFPIRVTWLATSAKVAEPSAGSDASSPTGPLVAPSNDQCAGAEVIPPSGPFPYTSGAYDITDATTTGDPAPPSCQPDVSHTIWFKFTPASTGNFTFALCSDAPTVTTVPDTVLAVYASTGACSGLTEVAGGCDDDSCVSGAQQSVISSLGLTGGSTYYVVASQFGSTPPSPGSSTLQLQVTQNSAGGAPPNDQCGGAEVIPGAGPFPYTTALTADITGATEIGDPPTPSCASTVSRSVWYTFTPASAGNYTFSTCADAPTGTTVDDTLMAIYASSGACSGLSEIPGGCDDDSCSVEAAQSVISGVPLTPGQTYDIVVWKFDTTAPSIGNTAVQLRVDKGAGPSNDFCSGAVPLTLDTPVSGTTVNATDDYELSGSACFTGLGQTATTAPGGDAVYKFTAPSAGSYSFRVNGYDVTKNAALYVASDCPGGSSPATVAGCLGAANRNTGNPAEEVKCLALASGQTVYVYVDEAAATTGSAFNVEVNACVNEVDPNDAPSSASELTCGGEGSITPTGDADFFDLGVPAVNSRVFALMDGVASSSTDYDLRVTNTADTLEYDDANNDTPFGSLSANIAGTPLGGAAAYLRLSHFSSTQQHEPYRIYAVVQPPSAGATAEVEPNGTTSTATTGANLYFSGSLSSVSDVDFFRFTANAGEQVTLGLDLDPTRDATPFNGILALLDAAGAALVTVNDSGATSSTTSGAGSLTLKTPNSPAEGLTYRIRTSGTYYARVSYSSGTAGDYLLSIARNCRVSPSTDVSVAQTDAPDPVALGANVTYSITVRNLGAAGATVVELRDDLPAGAAFVSATPSQGTCNGTGPVFCHLGNIAASGTATVSLVVTAPGASGTITNTAKVKTMTIDTVAANDASSEPTTVGSADADQDGVPDAQDCAPNDGTAWAVPGEATGLLFNVPANKASMAWTAPATPGGTVVRYDVVKSVSASDFTVPTCVATNVTTTSASDPTSPAAAFYYLVRAENACGGNLGNRSNGAPRSAGSCP